MICRGEKFFISKANRIDLMMEEHDMLLDKRVFYFIYQFMEDKGYDTAEIWDTEYDLENDRVCIYFLTGEYLNLYTDSFEVYTPQAIPTEKSRIVLPKGVDYDKYNLTRIGEDDSFFVDKVVFNYKTGYVEYYIQVFSDYGGSVETFDVSKEEMIFYLSTRNFTEN